MSSIRTIPEVDLSLLSDHRDDICAQIKHALVEYGAFYITSIDEHFDENIATLISTQAAQFFGSVARKKEQLAMINSKSFLGYTQEEDTSTHKTVAETLDLAHGGPQLEAKQDYRDIVGENQLPDGGEFPFFRKAVDNVFTSMGSFSDFITQLIAESLDLQEHELKRSVTPKTSSDQFFKLQLQSLIPQSSTSTTKPFAYSPRKESGLLTYIFQPASKEPSMQFQDIFGEWLDMPSTHPSIVVTVGQSLELITQGVAMASTYRFLPTSTARIVTPLHQHANLDSTLVPMSMDKNLLVVAKKRDQLRSSANKEKFQPESPVGKMLFLECVKRYREVSGKWHLSALKEVEQQEKDNKVSNDTKSQTKSINRQAKLVQLFTAFDSVIYLNVPTKTSDIKLFSLLPQVSRLCHYSVQLPDLLQLFYIWPTFISLKMNHDEEFIIDIDETRDMLSIKDIQTRVDKFASLLKKWIDDNKDVEIPTVKATDIKKKSMFKGLGERKRGRTEILQKDTTKKKKITKENGLSLLQRIKQKEQEKLAKFVSPEERYSNYLDGKVGQVLDIVATMRPDKPHTIDRLAEQVMNSLKTKNALAEKEARDLVLHLPKKFPDLFRIIKGRDISVLKWSDFDANEVKLRLSDSK